MSAENNKPKFGKANDTNNAFVKLKAELKDWFKDKDPEDRFITPLKFQAAYPAFAHYNKVSFRHPFYVARQSITGERVPTSGSKQQTDKQENEGTKKSYLLFLHLMFCPAPIRLTFNYSLQQLKILMKRKLIEHLVVLVAF